MHYFQFASVKFLKIAEMIDVVARFLSYLFTKFQRNSPKKTSKSKIYVDAVIEFRNDKIAIYV